MKTAFAKPETISRKWHLVDAKDQVLGRVASNVATLIMGKNKADFSTNMDTGDNVVVINAEAIVLTGKKADTKEYFSHSTYAGGERILSFKQLLAKDPTLPFQKAVWGMLPKNTRGRAMLKKLFIYAGEEHPHKAQNPVAIKF